MCGIIGYAGHRPAVPVVIEGLRRLEYRGYDSAGVACVQRGELCITRAQGKLSALEEKLAKEPVSLATCAMGHTRWATHGVPAERNAHPHASNDGRLAIVHNGIIENYQELKEELLQKGYVFHSETDTEVLVNLIAECHKQEPDLLKAFAAALRRAHGAYAVCLMSREYPGEIWAARMSAPLIFGIGTGEHFVASDIPAFLPYTRTVVFLEDGEIVHATNSEYEILSLADLSPVEHEPQTIQWDMQAAQKGGYRHFMLKEIFEQPKTIVDCIRGRINPETYDVILSGIMDNRERFLNARRIIFVACGTSWHASLIGEYLIEDFCRIPVEVEYASEFRYRNPVIYPDDIVIAVSQSGETADTLAAIELAKQNGAFVYGICNVIGSSIARATDSGTYIHVGPEIGVASTKAFTGQVTVLTMLALMIARVKGTIDQECSRKIAKHLLDLPAVLEEVLRLNDRIADFSKIFTYAHNFIYLGRGYNYPTALEGALKLKEISYIHAEGYPAAEMKHGPIALIDAEMPTIAIATPDHTYEKTASNIEEIKARGGKVITVIAKGDEQVRKSSDYFIEVPVVAECLMPIVVSVPLQLLAYHIAVNKGRDVDQPRNLAKSVTVE